MPYQFNETQATPLCEIMGRNKSDKGSADITNAHHNYTTVYHSLFKDLRSKPLRIFELGLGTNNTAVESNMGANGRPGASLYGWAEYFPAATIFGADIDAGCLFQTDRIKTYYCDQTNPADIAAMWAEPALDQPFDILIEDGLHTYSANVVFFENSIQKLAPGGYYIIEDICVGDIGRFSAKIPEWQAAHPALSFELVTIPAKNKYDNTLLIIH
jgi:hypothetical protein